MKIHELPDGSGFALASLPLPHDHWIYKGQDYDNQATGTIGEYLKNQDQALVRDKIRQAAQEAIRGATMSGKEMDFDPDALVINLLYRLLGENPNSIKCNETTPFHHPV